MESETRRLQPAARLLDPVAMASGLRACLPQFSHIEWVERTVSTNADLYARARDEHGGTARPWLLGTHLQDRGRGRAGRTWQSRRGANLMFSCAFDVFLPPRQLPALSPLAGLAACEALREVISAENRNQLCMKWPNDVQWRSAKLAGILVEVTRAGTARLAPDHHIAIIGMGINLEDARALSQSLNRRVADWAEISNADSLAGTATAVGLVQRIAKAWYNALNDVTARGFDDFPERYQRIDALIGQAVDVIDNDKLLHTGIASGVNTHGQLMLRTPAGETPITVGEISVRAHTLRSAP